MAPKKWDELSPIDKKILSLAGVTKSDVEEAHRNWYGTVYPYDIKLDDEWYRFYLTQAEVDEIYSTLIEFGCSIRNMGGRGKDKSDLPAEALTRSNLSIDEFVVTIIQPEKPLTNAEGLQAIAEKLLELEERVEALEEK